MVNKLFYSTLRKSVEIRATEDVLRKAYSDRLFGGTLHTCTGQEILSSYISFICHDETFVFSNHRGHGHYISHAGTPFDLFLEFLGKEGAPSLGIGGSQHLFAENFISNGIQGNTVSFAVGVGCNRPTIIYLGDGTFGQGALYEALNFSQLVKSNITFVVEDNGIAQSTPQKFVRSGDIPSRFSVFGIPHLCVDTAITESLAQIKKFAFSQTVGGPRAIVARTYRHSPHSKGDDTRPADELLKLPDPIQNLCADLNVGYDELYSEIRKKVENDFLRALDQADGSFSSRAFQVPIDKESNKFKQKFLKNVRVNGHISGAISGALRNGGHYLGEDIVTTWHPNDNSYGGAFGVSRGISDTFPNQVIGCPISESAIVGVAAGLAFSTQKICVAEIMFADFGTLIVDQLVNGLDKYQKMFGDPLTIPLAIRMPYGMGKGYGPTHSQTPIELFSGLSHVPVISYNPLINYDKLLERVQAAKCPVIIFEAKQHYGDLLDDWHTQTLGLSIDYITDNLFSPSIELANSNLPQIAVVTHGSVTLATLKALRSSKLNFSLLVVSQLYSPNAIDTWLKKQRSSIVVLEEKNCPQGPLSSVLYERVNHFGLNIKIHTNEHVENCPSNQIWESDLMLSEEVIMDIISEALI